MKTFSELIGEGLISNLKKIGLEFSNDDYTSEGNLYFTNKNNICTIHVFYDINGDTQAVFDLILEKVEDESYIKTYFNIYDYSSYTQILDMNYIYDSNEQKLLPEGNTDTYKQFLSDNKTNEKIFFKVAKKIKENINHIIILFRQSLEEESDDLTEEIETYFN